MHCCYHPHHQHMKIPHGCSFMYTPHACIFVIVSYLVAAFPSSALRYLHEYSFISWLCHSGFTIQIHFWLSRWRHLKHISWHCSIIVNLLHSWEDPYQLIHQQPEFILTMCQLKRLYFWSIASCSVLNARSRLLSKRFESGESWLRDNRASCCHSSPPLMMCY